MANSASRAVLEKGAGTRVRFQDWTGGRAISTVGTNTGAAPLPFQSWRPFKEAFAPELIDQAVRETPGRVRHIVDPFGGSGTTSLAAQFLGIRPTTIEVNPYLADLIEAKLAPIDFESIAAEFGKVVERAAACKDQSGPIFPGAPTTFVEPGHQGRFIFSESVAHRLLAYRSSIEEVEDPDFRRLFRVILGATAIPSSNVVVSGKGRRYRQGWRRRETGPGLVDRLFHQGVLQSLYDLRLFASRACRDYRVIRGDARSLVTELGEHDLAVFSPPYPNSFDYTDVYNVELWALGYLQSSEANTRLREATLRSHVQILRDLDSGVLPSPTLRLTIDALRGARPTLWNRHIPEMIGAYARDMTTVLELLTVQMRRLGRIYMVVGDSRYAGIDVPTAEILSEIAPSIGLAVIRMDSSRSMRASPQQGGRHILQESLLVLERN